MYPADIRTGRHLDAVDVATFLPSSCDVTFSDSHTVRRAKIYLAAQELDVILPFKQLR